MRVAYRLLYCFVLLLTFVAGAELLLRSRGFTPWKADPKVDLIRVEPGSKFFQKAPVLGYSHIAGSFVVTLRDLSRAKKNELQFRVTHLPNTLRITRPLETYAAPDEREQIWLFGCSFTHGWSVNDDETYAWRLQQRFPAFNVVNFGVSGYGTIHSLLQFREALKRNKPKLAVLAYASFHDERNTFARGRRKTIAPWNRLGPLTQPYARFDAEGHLQYFVGDVQYLEFPMMRYSTFMHFAETAYDSLEVRWLRSHAVSEALIAEMARLAQEHGVDFVVANIIRQGLNRNIARNGIRVVDISVDLQRPENTNLPIDAHPSALAHSQYAAKLATVVSEYVGAQGLSTRLDERVPAQAHDRNLQ